MQDFNNSQDVNNSICCDVNVCKHNVGGSQCKLCKIKVTRALKTRAASKTLKRDGPFIRAVSHSVQGINERENNII